MAKFPFKNLVFLMQKHLSSSASTTHLSASASASSSSFTVDYLMNSCGLPLKSAISTSRKLRGFDENNLQRSDSVISLLKSNGFVNAHIATMIEMQPNLLIMHKVEEDLKPKLEFLVESGFSGPLLHQLIVSSPSILSTSLSDRIMPSVDFLRSFLGTEERLKLAVKRDSRLLKNNLKAHIDLLLEDGVTVDDLRNFLVSRPRLMQPKFDRLVSALKLVKHLLNMGPTDPKFLLAVLSIAAIGDSLWVKKLLVFKSFGFSQQEVLSIFKRRPQCTALSEEKIRSKLSFYFNTAMLKKDVIISYPKLLGHAIETKVQPRHNVLKLLLSKKLLQEDTGIADIFNAKEDKFLSKYVTCYLQQVPCLLDMYNNDKAVKEIGII